MLTSLFSLFYVTGEFHRFLHQGRAQFLDCNEITEKLENMLFRGFSAANMPHMILSRFQDLFQSLMKKLFSMWVSHFYRLKIAEIWSQLAAPNHNAEKQTDIDKKTKINLSKMVTDYADPNFGAKFQQNCHGNKFGDRKSVV